MTNKKGYYFIINIFSIKIFAFKYIKIFAFKYIKIFITKILKHE